MWPNCPYSSNLYVQNVVMRFILHSVKELYSDLREYYDSREELGEFAFTESPTTVKFVTMLEALKPFGYRGGGQLYYLNPAPGSQPSTGLVQMDGLVQIDGQEEVDQLMLAHEKERIKTCHLYLVTGSNDDFHAVSIGFSSQKKHYFKQPYIL